MAEPGSTYLETERLRLRWFRPDDIDRLTELDADPAVMRFINGGRATPRDEIEDSVLPHFVRYAEVGHGYGFWAAEEKATGTFLGWFHLRPPHGGDATQPELGYRLRRDAWGHGYATEGARALVAKAFDELGAERVWASAMVLNAASSRVMEKAGLRHVRTFRSEWPEKIPGDEHGDVEYALTRDEWAAARRP